MHPAADGVPWTSPPRLGTYVDVAVAIHVADLELVPAQFAVENDVLREFALAEIFPEYPPGVLTAGGKQFLLLVGQDVRPAIAVEIGDGQRVKGAIDETPW